MSNVWLGELLPDRKKQRMRQANAGEQEGGFG